MPYERPPSTLPPSSIVDCYLRDSGGEKQDRSVPRQLSAIQAYCAEHGLKLRHIFKDVAKSGGSVVGRSDFDRMIASTRDEENRPNGILLWNYARFARDLDDSTYYKALLRSKRGIVIHSLTDAIPEGPYGRFVEILIDISNEEKRRQTGIDSKDGLRSIVMQGAMPGVPPRGFKREPILTINPRTGQPRQNHRWVPDPKWKHRIRRAFEMRAAGASLNEIQNATHLFSSINTYATFFPNKKYIGTLEFGDLVIENYFEPIVPRRIFEKVQKIQNNYAGRRHLKDQSLHPRRQASQYLLSGIARCGRCGSPLYGHTSHQKNGSKYQSYFCTLAYRQRGQCQKTRIPMQILENGVISTLTNVILKKENITALHRLLSDRQAGRRAELTAQRQDLNSQLADVRRQLTNLANAVAESGGSKTLLNRLSEFESRQLELETRLLSLDQVEDHPIPLLTPAELTARLKYIETIFNGRDLLQKKRLLRGLIAYIDVERKGKQLRGTIYYYLPSENLPKPPSGIPPSGTHPDEDDETVPTSQPPSGPPPFRHIFPHPFSLEIKQKSRIKNKHHSK